MVGERDLAERIVRGVRARYDGTRRNPFSEIECGAWYARSLAAWSLLPEAQRGPEVGVVAE